MFKQVIKSLFIVISCILALTVTGLVQAAYPFDEFDLQVLMVDFGDKDTGTDGYLVSGTFRTGTSGLIWYGISPLTEDVTIRVGTSDITIPAGSFWMEGERYVYRGVIDGAAIQASLDELIFPSSWRFRIETDFTDLTGTSNPVNVMLRVGYDQGEAVERIEGDLLLDWQIPLRQFVSHGDLALSGEHHFTSFHLREGHTLHVEPGQPLKIIAGEIIIDGTVDATAAGFDGGEGPGFGRLGLHCASGGGGGYGGRGGSGFAFCPD
jgi:hypothetical protein